MGYKMKNPFSISYYTDDELRSFGFKHVGKNVQVAQSCNIIGLENISLGNNVRIDGFTTIVASGTGFLNIGSYVHIGGYTFLSAGAGIIIKDFCGLSQGVKIYSKSDDYSGKKLTNPTISEEYTGVIKGTVTLEKHVIIGSGTVVLPNITLEEGVSVGAQSLVTKDLNEWGMYFGCPAKKIRDREKELLILEKDFLASQKLKQKN